jgi:hypothetical protein
MQLSRKIRSMPPQKWNRVVFRFPHLEPNFMCSQSIFVIITRRHKLLGCDGCGEFPSNKIFIQHEHTNVSNNTHNYVAANELFTRLRAFLQ